MRKEYADELDRLLRFAIRSTDARGRMVVDGEIDCKDSGWLSLAAVIRLNYQKQFSVDYALEDALEGWTRASVDVDDRRSAWTTFALLYAMFLSGGREGGFYQALGRETTRAFDRFMTRLDTRFLYEASRNYQVAAALINTLRARFGFITRVDCSPDDSVKVMLDAYLGDGFFNDDDHRGSGLDRRIDAYSAEIIGLLAHYDEINDWNSKWHDRVQEIVKDFCASNLYLIDSRGEYAKWGRSLRGEAEAKKLFIWEYAERHGLTASSGDGVAACQAQLRFFRETGVGADGKVFRDKGGDNGIWDEYTTHVQAQGYGAYGLAMALHYAADDTGDNNIVDNTGDVDASLISEPALALPARRESYVRYLSGPRILCVNDHATGAHCVIPLANRLTKLMYLWHNRITGENDVSVDMSPKFTPVPYFGKWLPAPYGDPRIPFLPLLKGADDELFIPRNLNPELRIDVNHDAEFVCESRFAYCGVARFEPEIPLELKVRLSATSNGLAYDFAFVSGDADASAVSTASAALTAVSTVDEKYPAMIYFYIGDGLAEFAGDTARVMKGDARLTYQVNDVDARWSRVVGGPSIYGPETVALRVDFTAFAGSGLNYKLTWERV